MTLEEFAALLELQSIDTDCKGRFHFWFDDGDIFWGHAVLVAGNLQDGLQNASMEG